MRLLGSMLILATALACQNERGSDNPPASQDRSQPDKPAAAQARTTEQAEPQAGAQAAPPPKASVAGLGSCTMDADLDEAVQRTMALADANSDGRISKKEAHSLSDFLIGGLFFRADLNNDGRVTPEEGKEIRKEVAERYPTVGALLRQAGEAGGAKPDALAASFLNIEYGQPLTMPEARQAARTAVDQVMQLVDANRDETITPAEVRDASARGARFVGRTAFQAADADGDGKLNQKEFQSALEPPMQAAFKAADRDNNGELSQGEAGEAMAQVAQRFGIPVSLEQASN